MMILKLLLPFLLISTLYTQELEKVSLQLQWLDQFQFAGYYIAKEKGFYKEAGLDFEIKKFQKDIKTVDEVIENRTTYGVGRSSLLIDRSSGKKIIMLASIFQSSPLVLLTTNPKIKSIKDIENKRVMVTPEATMGASLRAMMSQKNIYRSNFTQQKHTFNVDDLINKNTDLMASYISNEPFILKEKGISYKIFDPKDYGFDFYSDILFTSEDEIYNNPKRVELFKEASLKGWRYAFENIEETVDLILAKYNSQKKSKEALLFEAKTLKKLAYFNTKELGVIDLNKIQRISDVYNIMGLMKKNIDIKAVVYDSKKENGFFKQLTTLEIQYLKEKEKINLCIDPNWLPFEGIENKKHVGISAEYFKKFQKQLDVPINLVYTENWTQSLEYVKKRKCDIVSLAMETEDKKSYLNFTKPYLEVPLILVTKPKEPFYNDFSQLEGKKIGIVENYSYGSIIQKKYPNIEIIDVESVEEGLEMVSDRKLYGFIDTLATVGYIFQKRFAGELKVSGKFEEKWKLGMGVRNDDMVLYGIFQKIIGSIKPIEYKNILNKYISSKINQVVDYRLIWQILLVFLFVILIFIYRQRTLKNFNKDLKEKINEKTRDLQYAQKLAKIGSWQLNIKTQQLVFSNETYEIFELDKYKYPQLSLKEFVSLVSIISKLPFFEISNKNLQEDITYTTLHQIKTKEGKIKFIEERYKIVLNSNKFPIKAIGSVQDITEQKEAEFALKEKNEQLFYQSKQIHMGKMLSMIAHQWRQPLAAISATTSNLKIKSTMDKIDKEFFIQELNLIENYIQHLSSTIDDFRNFFKPDKEKKMASLKEILKSTLNIVKVSVEEKNITLISEFSCDEKLAIYKNEIKQVVLNIIKNAEDALLENEIEQGWIKIKVYKEDRKHILEISDNAGGIPKENMEKIFEPYFSTKKDKDGTGLGLHMSRLIVEDHCGGKIDVRNSLEGAIFRIVFELDR